MAEVIKGRFESPDELRDVPRAKVEVLNLGESTAMRATFEPGWKWSECVKPIAGTESCQVAHLGYVLSGTMVCVMDDGSEHTFKPGDAAHIPPGHDAWVTGDEPCVFLDFQGAANYAVPQTAEAAA